MPLEHQSVLQRHRAASFSLLQPCISQGGTSACLPVLALNLFVLRLPPCPSHLPHKLLSQGLGLQLCGEFPLAL